MKSLYVAILALVLSSCHNNEGKDVQELSHKVNKVEDKPLSTNELADNTNEQEPRSDQQQKQKQEPKQADKLAPPSVDWMQKIIKTANINVELKDYHAYNNSVHQTLASYGAYIAQEQQQESQIEINNEMSIKVPVDKFESLVNLLTADKKNKVLQKQITSSDVTAAYADIKSREETKRMVRAKYQQFMNDAKKIDDVLQLQSEINTITEDIEAAASKVKSLSHQSAYSTINLKFFQLLDASKANDDGEPGFGTKLMNAVKSGASFFGELMLVLASAWPLLLIGFGTWYFIKKKYLKKPQSTKVVVESK